MAEWNAEFTKLKAWQAAYAVGWEIYNLAVALPHPHLYSLGGQLQRAAISMPTNLAEGFGRRRSRDKAHFYTIAHSSGEELKCLLFFARDARLVPPERFESLMIRLGDAGRLIHGLIEGMASWHDPCPPLRTQFSGVLACLYFQPGCTIGDPPGGWGDGSLTMTLTVTCMGGSDAPRT